MRLVRSLCRISIAVLSLLALAAGCASDPGGSKTASSGDPLASQARRMRSSDGDREGTGLSEQSRDIERDLGLR